MDPTRLNEIATGAGRVPHWNEAKALAVALVAARAGAAPVEAAATEPTPEAVEALRAELDEARARVDRLVRSRGAAKSRLAAAEAEVRDLRGLLGEARAYMVSFDMRARIDAALHGGTPTAALGGKAGSPAGDAPRDADDEGCGALHDRGFVCNAMAEHAGQHVAYAGDEVVHRWPQARDVAPMPEGLHPPEVAGAEPGAGLGDARALVPMIRFHVGQGCMTGDPPHATDAECRKWTLGLLDQLDAALAPPESGGPSDAGPATRTKALEDALRAVRCAYCKQLLGDPQPSYPAPGSCEGCMSARLVLAAPPESGRGAGAQRNAPPEWCDGACGTTTIHRAHPRIEEPKVWVCVECGYVRRNIEGQTAAPSCTGSELGQPHEWKSMHATDWKQAWANALAEFDALAASDSAAFRNLAPPEASAPESAGARVAPLGVCDDNPASRTMPHRRAVVCIGWRPVDGADDAAPPAAGSTPAQKEDDRG